MSCEVVAADAAAAVLAGSVDFVGVELRFCCADMCCTLAFEFFGVSAAQDGVSRARAVHNTRKGGAVHCKQCQVKLLWRVNALSHCSSRTRGSRRRRGGRTLGALGSLRVQVGLSAHGSLSLSAVRMEALHALLLLKLRQLAGGGGRSCCWPAGRKLFR